MKEIDENALNEDARAGMGFIELRDKYGISPARAKKLRDAALGVEEPAEQDGEVAEPEAFDLTINIASDRIMPILRSVGAEELLAAIENMAPDVQATILQAVLQRKFDVLLQPSNLIELPEIAKVS